MWIRKRFLLSNLTISLFFFISAITKTNLRAWSNGICCPHSWATSFAIRCSANNSPSGWHAIVTSNIQLEIEKLIMNEFYTLYRTFDCSPLNRATLSCCHQIYIHQFSLSSQLRVIHVLHQVFHRSLQASQHCAPFFNTFSTKLVWSGSITLSIIDFFPPLQKPPMSIKVNRC